MDSTTLISKYLKEYNCLYKEANEIYHEAARRLHLSDSAFEIFYAPVSYTHLTLTTNREV